MLTCEDLVLRRVGLAQWYRACPRGKRSGFDARCQQPEMTLGIVAHSHPKSETEGTSGPTKWTSVQQKL